MPQGTAKRWDQVAAYVRTRTVPEVIDMAKHGLKAGRAAPTKASFTPTGKRNVTTINSDATARHEVFTDVAVNIAPSADSATANGGAIANGKASTNGKASANGASPAANGKAANGSARGAGGAAPAPATPPQPSPGSTPGPSGEWSDAQQLALVAAMKKFGKVRIVIEPRAHVFQTEGPVTTLAFVSTGARMAGSVAVAEMVLRQPSVRGAASCILLQAAFCCKLHSLMHLRLTCVVTHCRMLSDALLLSAAQEVEDRWECIATQVDGKTKVQCFKRCVPFRHRCCLKFGGSLSACASYCAVFNISHPCCRFKELRSTFRANKAA